MAPSLKEMLLFFSDGWKQNLAELWEKACGILPFPWDGIPSNGGNDA
jgi:hypothetical protein